MSDQNLSVPETERGVLGSILLQNDLYPKVALQLVPDAFSSRRCREIFVVAGELHHTTGPIDYLSVVKELKRVGRLERAGGLVFVSQLCDGVVPSNVDYYIRDVQMAFLRRKIDEAAQNGCSPIELRALIAEMDQCTFSWELPLPFHDWNLPAFPVSVLPGWLREFVAAEATATQTPPDLAGMLVLAMCAAACAKKIEVEVSPDYREPLNLFMVTALPPANRKTAVFSDVSAPLVQFEEEQVELMDPAIAQAASERRILEQRLKQAEQRAAKAKPGDRCALAREAAELSHELGQTQVPSSPRLVADDTSPEKLQTLLKEHQGRMAILSAEGDVFDLMAGRYSQGGAPNFGVYLRGHAGDTIRVDRVGRSAEYVPSPALTLGLAVQPEVLRGLIDKPGFRGRGLLARFLFSLPKSLIGSRNTDPPAMALSVRRSYGQGLRQLLEIPLREAEDGQPKPRTLVLSSRARALWHGFQRELEPQLAEQGQLGAIVDWAGKLGGAVARLAGVLHMARHCSEAAPWEVPISGGTMEATLRLGRYLIPHATAAFAEMGSDPVIEDAEHILRWIERTDAESFTKRDAFQGTKGRFKKVTAMEPGLGLLQQHGYIRQLPDFGRSGAGRKPSPTYWVNPHIRGNSGNSENTENLGEISGNDRSEDLPSSADSNDGASDTPCPDDTTAVEAQSVTAESKNAEGHPASQNSHNSQNAEAVAHEMPAVGPKCGIHAKAEFWRRPGGPWVCWPCHPPAARDGIELGLFPEKAE